MSGNILAIGKTGLFAAQAALSTTGHNITNANVAGYSRQGVVQATSSALDLGVGFLGTGTQIAQIKRYSDSFLNNQVRTAQASTSGLEAYYSQIKQIDNLLADQTSGLSPTLQDFFSGVQDMAANGASVPSRQAMLSSSQSLATRFQALDARLGEIREGVNSQIETSVTAINTYAGQIAKLNEQIANFATTAQRAPNDLLDQRDQLIVELNKFVKTSVRDGDNSSLTVSIGNGQPLVVGQDAFQLAAVPNPTDLSRLEVGYRTGTDKVSVLPDGALAGGQLGGVLEFRTNSLDTAQSALGKVAIGLAFEFNRQHELGVDQNGQPGKAFFAEAPAFVGKSIDSSILSKSELTAKVVDPSKLTDNDFEVRFEKGAYNVLRLSDGSKVASVTPDATGAATLTYGGVEFNFKGLPQENDNFVVRPTIGAAAGFAVLANDVSQIAAGSPIATSMPLTNTGTGKISEGKVDAGFLGTPPALPVTLSFDGASGNLTGFPAGAMVTVTDSKGVAAAPVPADQVKFANGSTYSFNGVSVTLSGAPGNGDKFTIAANSGGVGDTRNIAALGQIQTKNIFNGGTATLQSSYAQMVSAVGNKTREVQVNAQAGGKLLEQAQNAALDVSGVNLDEEATNLIKYQQAYQAAGKVMQIAGTVFDTLLSIGR